MASVYYHTVGGKVRGETGATRRDYLTDALGSVTGTVDQSSQVENVYRYKPYGGTLYKSGSAEDPRLRWTGDTGSRTTGDRYAGQYNRARHYGTEQGQWTAVDPLWPEEPAYGYVGGNPTKHVDPSGMAYCQGRNPCSDLGRSPRAICIAGLCSLATAREMAEALTGIPHTGNIPKDVRKAVQDYLDGIARGGFNDPRQTDPTGCCQEAGTGKSSGLLPNPTARLIRLICGSLPSDFKCLIGARSLGECYSCCDSVLGKPNSWTLLCKENCAVRFPEETVVP